MLRRTKNWFALVLLVLPFGVNAEPSLQASHTTIAELLNDKSLVSTQKNPFELITVQNSTDALIKQRFFIEGALHGNEALTSKFVKWLAARMANGRSLLNQLPTGIAIDFLPYANPDSYAKSRYNGHNVNLNRNFGVLWGIANEPFGTKPFSEAETRAIKKLIEQRNYLSAIDVHGYVGWVVAPSSPELIDSKYKTPSKLNRYQAWLGALGRHMKLLPNYSLKHAGGLGDGGAFEDWSFWGNGTMAFCLEMVSQNRMLAAANKSATDSYQIYEKFIFNMFKEALAIHDGSYVRSMAAAPIPGTREPKTIAIRAQ